MSIATVFVLIAAVLTVVVLALSAGRDLSAWAILSLCVALAISGYWPHG